MSKPKREVSNAEVLDGFANAVTRLGTGKDKSIYGGIIRDELMEPDVLETLYEQSETHAMAVDAIVDDGTRTGFFTLKGEDEAFDFSSLQSMFEDMGLNNALADAWRWARLYGGSLIVMNINDGGSMEDKLDISKAGKILGVQVIESRYVVPDIFNPGMGSRGFRDPEFYEVNLPFGQQVNRFTKEKIVRRIHRSRVIRFDGVKTPPTRMVSNGGWGPSALERPKNALEQLAEALGYTRNIMHGISIVTYKIDGLREKLVGTTQDKEEVRAVMSQLQDNVDNLHCRVMDKLDEVEESTRSMAGLDPVIGRFIEAAVRDTGIPRSKFTGEQPTGGLNNNGQTEIDVWHAKVRAGQDKILLPAINQFLNILFEIMRKTDSSIPDEWTVEFLPLSLPDEKEQAETAKTQAEADTLYIAADVTASDEVRARLISQGKLVPLEGAEDNGES